MDEKEKWGGGRRIRRGQMGKVLTYLDGMGQSFLLNIAWLPMSVTYYTVHKYIILIVNLPPE